MESGGYSAGLQIGGDVGDGWTISDATDLDQLGKWFHYFQIGGDCIGGFGATVFWSTNWDPTNPFKAGTVFGAELGPSAGVDVNVNLGKSYTLLQNWGWWGSWVPDLAWDTSDFNVMLYTTWLVGKAWN
jgi:hypothetical protein